MKKFIIQDEIKVSQQFIDETIEHYKKMKPSYKIGFGNFIGGPEEIIIEITTLSEIGKRILLMKLQFEEWKKEHELDRQSKH